jgi:transcriptional regulator of heat shock response
MELVNTTEITHRQAKILAALVKENCDSGQPVASSDIAEKYNLGVSPATIRSEMARLEEMGFIAQPHTSAGRVPTDVGFRYFVNQLMERVKLGVREQEQLKSELQQLQAAHVEMGRRIARLLASHSDQASFAVFPETVASTGMSKILDNPNLPPEDAKEIARFFDNLDENAQSMLAEYCDKGPEARIGKEIQLSKKSDYSMIVSGIELPSGKKGVIGLVGPKSMKYEKNLTLMEYVSKLLGAGAAVMVLILIK